MKTKIVLTLGLMLALLGSIVAQKGEKGERMAERKAQKVAFITERLALTPDESKVFWPVYEAKNEAQRALYKDLKADRKTNPQQKLEEMTDDEVKVMLTNMLEKKQGNLDIQKEYNAKFLAILPAKKVAKLYHVEREFGKQQRTERKDSNED